MASHASRPSDLGAILDSIRELVRALRETNQAAERDLGISGAQLFVLQTLGASAGPMSVNDLAEATLTHQSSVSVVVKKLVARGLVKRRRAADDARRWELAPTRKGQDLLRRAPPTAQQRLVEATRRLPPAMRAELSTGLAALVAELRPAGERTPMFFEEEEEEEEDPK